MYVVGGSDGQSSLNSVEIYDFDTMTWTHGPTTNVARANVALAVVGQRLYAVGGFSGKHFLNSIEFLAKDMKEWSTFAPRLSPSQSGSESDAPVSDVESVQGDVPTTSRANGMGGIDADRFATSLEQIGETYEFKTPPDASLYFTDAYLPDASALALD